MIVGDQIMLARVLMKKGAHVPLHHHHNEQVTYILEGALKFNVGGKEILVRAGEVLCIPPTCLTRLGPKRILSTSTFSIRLARTGSTKQMIICATDVSHRRPCHDS